MGKQYCNSGRHLEVDRFDPALACSDTQLFLGNRQWAINVAAILTHCDMQAWAHPTQQRVCCAQAGTVNIPYTAIASYGVGQEGGEHVVTVHVLRDRQG